MMRIETLVRPAKITKICCQENWWKSIQTIMLAPACLSACYFFYMETLLSETSFHIKTLNFVRILASKYQTSKYSTHSTVEGTYWLRPTHFFMSSYLDPTPLYPQLPAPSSRPSLSLLNSLRVAYESWQKRDPNKTTAKYKSIFQYIPFTLQLYCLVYKSIHMLHKNSRMLIMQRLYSVHVYLHAAQCSCVAESSDFEFAIFTENKAGQVFGAGKC